MVDVVDIPKILEVSNVPSWIVATNWIYFLQLHFSWGETKHLVNCWVDLGEHIYLMG